MLCGTSGLTLYLVLKASFVISGFCIAEDPAAGLNHCIPVWAAHRNHPGGKTHTNHHRVLLFAEGQVRMGVSKQELRFLTQEQSSGLLKHPNISGCHSLTCSPRDGAALVNPCCSVGPDRGKPHQMCRQDLHH